MHFPLRAALSPLSQDRGGHAAVDDTKSGIVEISDDCVIQHTRDKDSRGLVDNWPMFYTVQTKFNLVDKLLT
jgi:hypothetical protein